MSLLLLNTAEPPCDPMRMVLNAIHQLMGFELQALDLQVQGQLVYQTSVVLAFGKMELQWRFQPVKGGNMRVRIRPSLSDGAGGNFRVQAQRGFVDLLRVINSCNRDKNKTFSVVITEYNFIEICTTFLSDYFKDLRFLRKAIRNTNAQLPTAIDRLLVLLKPFLEPRAQSNSEEGVTGTAKLFLDRSYKLLLLTKYNQIKSQQQMRRIGENDPADPLNKDVGKKLEEYRAEALRKLKDCFKLMGVDEAFLKNPTSCDLPAYSEWMNRASKQASPASGQEKNVFSVKILSQSSKEIEKDCLGSHCRILMSKFKLVIELSVNSEVNSKLLQLREKQTQKVSERELVKKVVRNPNKSQSKNSFQNELDFILYIKERSCRYVSTYYWDCSKNRENIPIIMDPYPLNLRQLLHSQGKLLSFRQKLRLVYRIIGGVNWLNSNYVCHRDIKPQNIMISERKEPKLVDFGSCCPVNGVGNTHFHVCETRLLGTQNYYHPYNDSFAYAYKKNEYEQHLLFDAYSLGQVMRDVFEEGLPNLLPNLQGLTRYIIERCEEPDPVDRLTYQEMLYLFENFLSNLQWLQHNE